MCQDANVVFTSAIAYAIRTGASPERVYGHAFEILNSNGTNPAIGKCLRDAESAPPSDYLRQQGWVVIALQNAFFQLLHAPNLEQGTIDTVRRGGDTDTNGGIAGALLGAVHGLEAVAAQWLECILTCRPQKGTKRVQQPRLPEYWPIDILSLAEALLGDAAADAAPH